MSHIISQEIEKPMFDGLVKNNLPDHIDHAAKYLVKLWYLTSKVFVSETIDFNLCETAYRLNTRK
jgi:hypothetical protein